MGDILSEIRSRDRGSIVDIDNYGEQARIKAGIASGIIDIDGGTETVSEIKSSDRGSTKIE